MTPNSERHVIKKYANRKLYDTRTSRYITLDGIAELVRNGHDIKVVDRASGSDLTPVILSQIVLSEEKRGPHGLMGAGTDGLHERGQALLDYVRRTLNVPQEFVTEVERRRGNLEGVIDEAIERTLRRLRMPTRHDIERIDERLDRITAELKGAGGRASNARSRKRKIAR